MTSQEIRHKFLTFFREKDHKIVPSAPIVIKDDPSLMFTNAGMNQFKDIFLGHVKNDLRRVADTQKCLRVSGKHNDLDEVGVDTYHHTMFEMLGNWSLGDYFKKEAIEWAHELLMDVFKIDPVDLYFTYFEGDDKDDLKGDIESKKLWESFVPSEKVLPFGKSDNFWEMGSSGPCGPCSEIHIDLRAEDEKLKTPGKELVNTGHPEVIEIWNLVFIQYNRKADGSLENLPLKHVDTGMGFERLAMVLQGKKSTYDTDIFATLIKRVEERSGKKYGADQQSDIAIRVVIDHIRAICFSIADGQLPSNTGAGYVIRRILRRAVRYAYSQLNITEAFIYTLVKDLSVQFKDVFPEINEQQEFISKVIREEELSFLRTLESGLKKIETLMEQNTLKIDGAAAFELYDTYGFPLDLTQLIAAENKMTVDEQGFEAEMVKQKQRSKDAAGQEVEDWEELLEDEVQEFVGYDILETTVKIVRYRKVKTKKKSFYQLVFNVTPFYAESGGQIGDTGYIQSGDEKISIVDTKKENNITVHYADKLPSNINADFTAAVDQRKRAKTILNHSATHLMHAALRSVLGDHVQQKGSLVNEKHLRFDFSHFSKLSDEEIDRVEELVNQKIREDIHKEEERSVPFQDALDKGAMALFGEKYGDVVRVITFDPEFSVELCGGCHANSTGNIGFFKIVSESSISAGVRRIEAVTGEAAHKLVKARFKELDDIKALIPSANTSQEVKKLMEENAKLKKSLELEQLNKAQSFKKEILASNETINGIEFMSAIIELDAPEAVKNLAYTIKNEHPNALLVLGVKGGEKAMVTISIGDKALKDNNLSASTLIKVAAKEIKGGGGGQAFYATAGGADQNGLKAAIDKVKEAIS